MKSIEMQAKIIDLLARTEALESVFWGLIKSQEEPLLETEMKKLFQEFYLELVSEQLQKLPSSLSQKIGPILEQRLQDMEHQRDKYLMFASYDETLLKLNLEREKNREEILTSFAVFVIMSLSFSE